MSLIREALKKAASERTQVVPPGEKTPEVKSAVSAPASPPVTTSVDPRVVCHTAPHSPEAEQYRNLRANLCLALNGSVSQVIMVASAMAGEGKSLTAVNLALALAQDVDRKVILVDGDLRHPQVHKLLGLPPRPGLSDYLQRGVSLEAVLSPCEGVRLSVLCAGTPVPLPSELISSSRVKHLLEELRARFDYVIFDTCPLLPVSDSRLLSPLADGVILVVRAGRTQRETVTDVLQRLGAAKVLGIVLNDVEPLSLEYHYRGMKSEQRG